MRLGVGMAGGGAYSVPCEDYSLCNFTAMVWILHMLVHLSNLSSSLCEVGVRFLMSSASQS